MDCGEVMEGHSNRVFKVEVGWHGAEADVCVVGCGEVWVSSKAIGFGDSGGDACVYRNLSLLVLFFRFSILSLNLFFHFFSVFFVYHCCILQLLFFFLISVGFCLGWFFCCVESGTW